MDISETFIKMCGKAEEIQDLRKDFKSWIDVGKGIPDMGYINNRLWFYTTCDEDYSLSDAVDHGIIWLPRQDQLQEMVQGEDEDIGILLDAFVHFAFHITAQNIDDSSYIREQWRSRIPCGSMEQMWLAFVMKEKYNKIWNGEDWINAEVSSLSPS